MYNVDLHENAAASFLLPIGIFPLLSFAFPIALLRCHPPHLSPLPHWGEETSEGVYVCHHSMAYAKLNRPRRYRFLTSGREQNAKRVGDMNNFISLLFFLSGITGLVYEALWAKYLSLLLGPQAAPPPHTTKERGGRRGAILTLRP